MQIDIREYRIQLWPGYQTSVRQHERDKLLCAEIAHKVMRTETVYDILQRCLETARDYQEDFRRQVLGMTVLTDYNNKTYSVNDIDFAKTPKETFIFKNQEVSFIDYYYNVRLKRTRLYRTNNLFAIFSFSRNTIFGYVIRISLC